MNRQSHLFLSTLRPPHIPYAIRAVKLLGIGINEKAGIVVSGDRFRVIGKGRVAIYDNRKHGNNWYYWLKNGDVFNLRTRLKESTSP